MDLNWICVLLFLVATLYSMVGHGGASGYLAVLTLAGISTAVISSTSLVLNLFVAGIAFVFFAQAKNFSWKLTWPFLVLAIPASYLGATIPLSAESYSGLLGLVLIFAAIRLFWQASSKEGVSVPSMWLACAVGASIGLLSGMVGVGGGIFLSPILLLFRWADPKTTATTSSIFISANSLAGLAGRWGQGSLRVPEEILILIVVCVAGAICGSFLGAQKLGAAWIRTLLGAVLVTAAFKLLF